MLYNLLAKYDKENKPEDIFTGSPALETKREHVEHVEQFGNLMFHGTTKNKMDYDLFIFCLRHHDDGRVDQFKLLGKFWDTEAAHTELGVKRFNLWLSKQNCKPKSPQIQIFRDVLLYHGRPNECPNMDSKPYVELVTAADDLENASACVGYLLREVKEDAKGYRHDNPNADQRTVSDFVLNHFASGEKFDKLKYCHTYGEYILFAATLMTSCIKKYPFAKDLLLQPGYGYSSIWDGYRDVFEQTLDPQTSAHALQVMCRFAGC